MRHEKAFRKLGRTPAHRRALFRNLATSLVLHNRIETTLPKAKELKRIADKLVTLGKKNNLHARRQAAAYLQAINRESSKKEHGKTKLTAVHKLFEEIAPRFSERNGGYTRVVRSRVRDGDKAQLAFIEFVEAELKEKEPARKTRRVRKVAPAAAAAVAAEAVAEEDASVASEEAAKADTPETNEATEASEETQEKDTE